MIPVPNLSLAYYCVFFVTYFVTYLSLLFCVGIVVTLHKRETHHLLEHRDRNLINTNHLMLFWHGLAVTETASDLISQKPQHIPPPHPFLWSLFPDWSHELIFTRRQT